MSANLTKRETELCFPVPGYRFDQKLKCSKELCGKRHLRLSIKDTIEKWFMRPDPDGKIWTSQSATRLGTWSELLATEISAATSASIPVIASYPD